MLYEVVNKPKKVDYGLLDSLLSFSSDFLSLEEDIYLILEFNSNIEPHIHGYCLYDHDEIHIEVNSRLTIEEMVVALFHELIHVKQYESGDLMYDGKSSFWKGSLVECDYKFLPWEEEAYRIEKEMMEKYRLTLP